MSDNNNIAIIGYSGHAFVVAETYIEMGKKIDYYTNLQKCLNNPLKLKYLGFEFDENFLGWEMNLKFILGVGDNKLREKVAHQILNHKKKIETVVHPNSSIFKSAEIGIGVFVSNGVLINSFAKIENFAILNTGCVIEHECVIGESSHIAPGSVLAGNVSVGKRTFIGANSVIKQGVIIGDDVIIGAGSVIINDIESNMKIVGNPGRISK